MKRSLYLLLVLTLALGLVFGCAPAPASAPASAPADQAGEAQTDAPQEGATQADSGFVIAASFYSLGNDFANAMLYSIQETVEKAGGTFKYLVCDEDVTKQNNQIESFITEGVDAIIIAAADSMAVMSSVTKCNEANIPVFWIDRILESTDTAKIDFGAGASEYDRAADVAQWMVDNAKEKGISLKIALLVGGLTDNNAVLRDKGFTETFESNPDVCQIVTKINTDWDTEKALSGTINALQANPDINCIVSPADYVLDPIVSALQQTNRYLTRDDANHIILNGFDGNPISLQGMKDGYVDVCGASPIYQCGVKVAEVAISVVQGGEAPAAEEGLLPGLLITPENYDETAPLTYTYIAGSMK